jgi:exodeoxyribonuclease V beta subunit
MTEHYPRPLVLESIPRGRHAVIEASAGTGKTYTIEHLVIDLIIRAGVPLEKILVLTFTERAATELRLRIRSKLEEILFEHCQEAGCDHDRRSGVWWVDTQAKQRLSAALFSFDEASIGTIHGFFSRVLAEHAFDVGRPFEGVLGEGPTLFSRAFKQVLRRSLARGTSVLTDLFALYLERGTGIEKLEDNLYRCYASWRVLRPTFSFDSLRREIESNLLFESGLVLEGEQIRQVLKAAGVHGNTVKAIGTRLARLVGLIQGSKYTWQIVMDKEFQECIRYISHQVESRGLEDEDTGRIVAAARRFRDHLVSLDSAIVQTCLPMVTEVLKTQKTGSGQFDYDDLVQDAAGALDGLRGGELISAIRARYRVALIDEFQDTDKLQWSFFRRVFLDSGAKSIIYLIGDPKQAIYGFRGADVETYLDAREEIERGGTPRVPLAHNFRSTSEMIDAYNCILCSSARGQFFTGVIQYDVPVTPGQNLVAEAPRGRRTSPIRLLKIEPQGTELRLHELRRGLARQIAQEVRAILAGTDGLWVGSLGRTEPIRPSDIFVLTARNSEALVIADALRAAGVPSALYKQDGLFQTTEARNIRDLLMAIEEPADPGWRGRAWLTPFFSLSLDDLPHLANVTEAHLLLQQLREWNKLADQRHFEKLFNRVLDDSRIIRRELFFKDDERALTNYLHIFEILLEHARATGCELADLIAILTAYIQERRKPPGENSNVQRLESDQAAVQIMTIHKSKGLEAAVVFVYGGFTAFPSDGLYEYHEGKDRVLWIGDDPAAKDKAAGARRLEQERLYYVAMTRAKARLYLPLIPAEQWSNRWDGGYGLVNRRLLEIEAKLGEPDIAGLFEIVTFRDKAPGPDVDSAEPEPALDLEHWYPEAILFDEQSSLSRVASHRKWHAGYEVTSYSRMKISLDRGDEVMPLSLDDIDHDVTGATELARPADGQLPGGTNTGSMLHEILEKVPFDSPVRAGDFDEWRALEEVADTVTAAMERNNIPQDHRPEVEKVIYRALTCAVRTSRGCMIPGLHLCANLLREMEFIFPFPERVHPTLLQALPGRLVIERGFIKGYVDLIVEHEGLVYFADWKSDVLQSYDHAAMKEHVSARYDLQIRLYVLAVVKALAVHTEPEYENRFGGLCYIFLRGLGSESDGSTGIYFQRPSWPDVLSYELALREVADRSRRARS